MNTEEMMGLALKLAGLEKVPEDSAIYMNGRNIRKVLFGIDVGASELLLAKQLGCDCAISHHPISGTSAIDFAQVFRRHIQQMVDAGIPRKEAEKAVSKKLEQLDLDAHTRNYGHAVDVAGLLKMPYMNIHTPLDEIGRRIMANQARSRISKDSIVQDVVSALNRLGEFRNATTKIKIPVGKPVNPAGKVVVSHGAGTNGGYEIARTYFQHGIDTVIYIHVSPADVDKLRADNRGNLVVTGHVASDSVGINPFLRALEKEGVSVTTIGVISDSVKG